MKRILLIIVAISVIFTQAFSQDTLSISRNEFVEKVKANSFQVKITSRQTEMAKADFQQSNAVYLPKISMSYSAITTNNPLMAFGSKLNQEIISQEDFSPDLLNNPDRVQNFATEILVLQPLLNLDAVSARNAARIQKEAYELKAARTSEYLELEAKKLYMQLQLGYEAVGVLGKAKATAEQAVKMVSDYYEQGLVQKADLLDAQVHRNEVENQLQYAISNIQNTSDQLVVLMGSTPDSKILKPDARTPIDFEQVSSILSLPENRKDMMAMNKAVTGYEYMLKSKQKALLPRINAFGSFQVYDKEMWGFGANGYVIGAKLSWDIFNGYTNIAQKNKAHIELDKARIEQQEYVAKQQAELDKVIRMLTDARNKVDLSKLNFEQASEAYKIRKDRFEQGLEKTIDLLLSESQKNQKELQYQQAISEYNFTKEYLDFLIKE